MRPHLRTQPKAYKSLWTSKGIVGLLKGTAGGASDRKSFDFCGKFLGMGASRQAAKAGAVFSVADAEFTDGGGEDQR